MGTVWDVVVVGGGAAGLSAATVLAQARRRVLVIDAGRPRNRFDNHIHGLLGNDGLPPLEFVAKGRDEVVRCGGEILEAVVTDIDRLGDDRHPLFRITTGGGATIDARRLLIATGVSDTLPDVPGLADFWGGKVFHCPYCHGPEIAPEAVVGILAWGEPAIDEAHLLRQWTENVVLLLNDAVTPTERDLRGLAARGIAVVPGRVESVVTKGSQFAGVAVAGEMVRLDELLIAPEVHPDRHLLDALGVGLADRKDPAELPEFVDEAGATDVDGVWVAGNLRDVSAQVVESAGHGLRAAIGIIASLLRETIDDAIEGNVPPAGDTPMHADEG